MVWPSNDPVEIFEAEILDICAEEIEASAISAVSIYVFPPSILNGLALTASQVTVPSTTRLPTTVGHVGSVLPVVPAVLATYEMPAGPVVGMHESPMPLAVLGVQVEPPAKNEILSARTANSDELASAAKPMPATTPSTSTFTVYCALRPSTDAPITVREAVWSSTVVDSAVIEEALEEIAPSAASTLLSRAEIAVALALRPEIGSLMAVCSAVIDEALEEIATSAASTLLSRAEIAVALALRPEIGSLIADSNAAIAWPFSAKS